MRARPLLLAVFAAAALAVLAVAYAYTVPSIYLPAIIEVDNVAKVVDIGFLEKSCPLTYTYTVTGGDLVIVVQGFRGSDAMSDGCTLAVDAVTVDGEKIHLEAWVVTGGYVKVDATKLAATKPLPQPLPVSARG